MSSHAARDKVAEGGDIPPNEKEKSRDSKFQQAEGVNGAHGPALWRAPKIAHAAGRRMTMPAFRVLTRLFALASIALDGSAGVARWLPAGLRLVAPG